jgi:hypothetical protein
VKNYWSGKGIEESKNNVQQKNLPMVMLEVNNEELFR